ncbi:hypothetical protein [Aequorivita sediminis]|uniref:hypothetical protein n=1 Tax=Aequorivita sediminis TaxID=3073653 RepID=UPI0028A74C1B|nr:hypothetical protein [Aequorivita sp. F6058]
MKKNLIEFLCPICEKNKSHTKSMFIAHIDIQHSDIERKNKEDIICDYDINYLTNKITNTETELINLKKELNKLKLDKKKTELNELRNKVLAILEPLGIDDKSLKVINTRKSIQKLKVYLSRGINKKYRIYLDEHKIDYQIPLIKKKKNFKKKTKLKKEKDYFDRTSNSVRAIYTPMGNRR